MGANTGHAALQGHGPDNLAAALRVSPARPSTSKACLAVIPTVPALLPGQAIGLVPNDILERLEEHARQAQGALAPETERALRKASAAFSSWTAAQGLPALPATPETLAAYVDALTGLGRKPASIRQAVWAVATLHRAAVLPDPAKAEVVRLALKRMARTLGTRQRQAAPLGKAELIQIFDTTGINPFRMA